MTVPTGRVPREILDQLKTITSGTLTTQLFKRGLRQNFLVGLIPLNPQSASFVGEAFTMRLIPAREDIDVYQTLTPYSNPDNLQWEGVDQIGKDQVLVIDARNSIVHSSNNKLIVLQGLDNFIVVNTDDVLLVCKRDKEQEIKDYVAEVRRNKRDEYL